MATSSARQVGFARVVHTDDAHRLYARFGFGPPSERYMERPRPTGTTP